MNISAMHSLLRRQLKRCVPDAASLPADVAQLVEAVDAAYRQEDADRAMLERSLDIVSQELIGRNAALRTELEERALTEQRLEQSLSLLRATLEATADGILVVDNRMNIESCNQTFLQMWGMNEDMLEHWDSQRRVAFIASQVKDWEGFLDSVERLVNSGDESRTELIELKDGRVFERLTRPRYLGGMCVGRVWSFRDVTARCSAEQRLDHLAHYDQLTQLPNRNLLLERLHGAMQRTLRQRKLMAVLFVDLDHFKDVNDTLGHPAGDVILQQMARRIEACCRRTDLIARMGADEYAIVLEDMQQCEFAYAVAQQLLEVCGDPFSMDGREVSCTVSIGVTVFPNDADSVEDLLKNADTAMYAAKEAGRNTYQRFTSEMNSKANQRLQLVNSLRRALDRQEFRLLYQPQLDMRTGRVAGVEALLRWDHPELGLVNPNRFIAMLEETGIILPAGEWLLREACQLAASLANNGLAPLRMSINISTKQLRQKRFYEHVMTVLAETGLDPSLLELEITESVLAETHLDTLQLERLRERGIRFAVDDFGTGYSSLAYLKRFPLDALKVDRSFVSDMLVDSDSAAITTAVIALAHSLNLRVVAEGAESADQLAYLKRLGCDEVQGFVYAMPMSADELIEWLKSSDQPHLGTPKGRLAVA